jgi:hypothetical protein
MARFRFQFTLRTLLIVFTLCAVVMAIVKCEVDARREFWAKSNADA